MNQQVNTAIALRVLARLLSYPDAAWRDDLPDMRAALLAERTLCAARKDELIALIDSFERDDPLDAEARYVELFDRGRATSLHLFEHVHGDSRDRGTAMVDLTRTYEQAGLVLVPGELPDFLPALLEFASTQPPAEACSLLGEMAQLINAIFNALQRRESAYACVLGALLDLAGETVRVAEPSPEEPIDVAWAEPQAFSGCSSSGQASRAVQPIHFAQTARDRAASRPSPTGASS